MGLLDGIAGILGGTGLGYAGQGATAGALAGAQSVLGQQNIDRARAIAQQEADTKQQSVANALTLGQAANHLTERGQDLTLYHNLTTMLSDADWVANERKSNPMHLAAVQATHDALGQKYGFPSFPDQTQLPPKPQPATPPSQAAPATPASTDAVQTPAGPGPGFRIGLPGMLGALAFKPQADGSVQPYYRPPGDTAGTTNFPIGPTSVAIPYAPVGGQTQGLGVTNGAGVTAPAPSPTDALMLKAAALDGALPEGFMGPKAAPPSSPAPPVATPQTTATAPANPLMGLLGGSGSSPFAAMLPKLLQGTGLGNLGLGDINSLLQQLSGGSLNLPDFQKQYDTGYNDLIAQGHTDAYAAQVMDARATSLLKNVQAGLAAATAGSSVAASNADSVSKVVDAYRNLQFGGLAGLTPILNLLFKGRELDQKDTELKETAKEHGLQHNDRVAGNAEAIREHDLTAAAAAGTLSEADFAHYVQTRTEEDTGIRQQIAALRNSKLAEVAKLPVYIQSEVSKSGWNLKVWSSSHSQEVKKLTPEGRQAIQRLDQLEKESEALGTKLKQPIPRTFPEFKGMAENGTLPQVGGTNPGPTTTAGSVSARISQQLAIPMTGVLAIQKAAQGGASAWNAYLGRIPTRADRLRAQKARAMGGW